jgi:Uncharacterized protein conserved in bacteria
MELFHIKMFVPIAGVIGDYGAISVAKNSSFQNFKDVVDAYKKDPDSVKMDGGSVRGIMDHLIVPLKGGGFLIIPGHYDRTVPALGVRGPHAVYQGQEHSQFLSGAVRLLLLLLWTLLPLLLLPLPPQARSSRQTLLNAMCIVPGPVYGLDACRVARRRGRDEAVDGPGRVLDVPRGPPRAAARCRPHVAVAEKRGG